MLVIESDQNPKVKMLSQLKDKRGRKKWGKILIEGKREVLQAFQSGLQVESLFIETISDDLNVIINKVPTFQLTSSLFEKLSYRSGSGNCLAVAEPIHRPIKEIKERGLYLVLENIEKPGNLGAILRTADGAGVDGIFITSTHVDIDNPNAIRASLGAIFHMPISIQPLSEVVSLLQQKNIPLVATSPYATKDYWQVEAKGGVALLLGSEKDGISEQAKLLSNEVVRIPMCGKADSLNVSAAASLLIYEMLRQRSI